MNKQEFLDILRKSLEGEVAPNIIEQNIKYYDQYISSHSDTTDKDVFKELGDPRLIARTIIETDRIAKQKGYAQGNRYDNSSTNHNQTDDDNMKSTSFTRPKSIFSSIKWYHKLEVLLVIFILLSILYLIGRLFVKLFVLFGIPLLFILVIYILFRKRQ